MDLHPSLGTEWAPGPTEHALIEARCALAELHGFVKALPPVLQDFRPFLLGEAVASCGMENVHAALVDALRHQVFPERERSGEALDVLCYADALSWAFEEDTQPMNRDWFMALHRRLLVDESAGSLRRGKRPVLDPDSGAVRFEAPPAEDLDALLEAWNAQATDPSSTLDPLQRAAAAHVMLGWIHPFEDGNGRVGRIVLLALLQRSGLLSHPLLFISGYLSLYRTRYYQALDRVQQDGDWVDIFELLLKAIRSQAVKSLCILERVAAQYRSTDEQLQRHHHKIYSEALHQALFSHPVVAPIRLAELTGVHYTTATRHLRELAEAGLLEHRGEGKYQFYYHRSLLDLMH